MAAFFSPGKYYMTDQDDPDKKSEMQAAFLLGEQPPPNLPAGQRRVVVAAYMIYNPDNYWFARAYVNRIWNELIGDGFYAVDSLGPDKDVVHQLIANRLGYTFRAGDSIPSRCSAPSATQNVSARDPDNRRECRPVHGCPPDPAPPV